MAKREQALRKELEEAKAWREGWSGTHLGGDPINTEGLRLLWARYVRLLEILTVDEAKTPFPTRHHA